MNKELPVLQCPICGRQYMPAEIFMPDEFFGHQKEVIRKPSGEIDFYIGTDPELQERYICDGCGTELMISAQLSYDVVPTNELFEEEFVAKVQRPKKPTLEEADIFSK